MTATCTLERSGATLTYDVDGIAIGTLWRAARAHDLALNICRMMTRYRSTGDRGGGHG
jgi:hypothetical protein